jgi:hypothetical protein
MRLGDVYRIRMYPEDGIKPRGDDTYRYKYIIIVGRDNNNEFYGAAVTNTKDHHLIPVTFQYPLIHQGYRCYVNCYKLYNVPSKRLEPDCHHGNITKEHYDLIVECIKTSPMIPKKVLKKYGLI